MDARKDGAGAYWWATNLQTYLDRFLAAPSAQTHGPLLEILAQYRAAVEKREVAPPTITKTWDGATRRDN